MTNKNSIKKEKCGFLNLVDYFPKTKPIYISNYLNLSFLCKAAEARSGRAPSSQLGVFPKDVRVQKEHRIPDVPVRGALSKTAISLFTLILFLALIPFASASIITGFRQIEYSSGNGELSVNSSTLNIMTANTSRIYNIIKQKYMI